MSPASLGSTGHLGSNSNNGSGTLRCGWAVARRAVAGRPGADRPEEAGGQRRGVRDTFGDGKRPLALVMESRPYTEDVRENLLGLTLYRNDQGA
jgi:hypothetical protein